MPPQTFNWKQTYNGVHWLLLGQLENLEGKKTATVNVRPKLTAQGLRKELESFYDCPKTSYLL